MAGFYNKTITFIILSFLTILGMSNHISLAINISSSLPQHVFLVIKNQAVKKGNYVTFYPKKNSIYDNKIPFTKIVAGTEGDIVKEENRRFYVNNQYIGKAKLVSSKGTPLKKGLTGTIRKNELFVYSPNPDSFDSRYSQIGWIPYGHVVGRAYPIF